jgi:hypothetical protein
VCDFAERKEQLPDKSERLAIAYGLISTTGETPILVFKNTRSCKDCHEFAKRVSVVTGRELVVRDANRFIILIQGNILAMIIGDFGLIIFKVSAV